MKPVELSEKTGISESTVSQYRSGYAKPKEQKLAIIANTLDVNPSWLMGLDVPLENTKYQKSTAYEPEQVERAMELYNRIQSLKESNRNAILTLIYNLQ